MRAEGAVRGIERGQRDARHRRRQREGQIDGRVEEPRAGKAVAHQHPGKRDAEDEVEERGEQRQPEGQVERRPDASVFTTRQTSAGPKKAPFSRRAPIGRMTTSDSMVRVIPMPGRSPAWGSRWINGSHGHASLRDVDLVEDAAVAEVFGLHLGPAAEAGDVTQFQLREARHVLGVRPPRCPRRGRSS